MGELEEKPFLKACEQKLMGEEAKMQYAMLCSEWQENLKDPAWHPFKHVGTEGKKKVCYASCYIKILSYWPAVPLDKP